MAYLVGDLFMKASAVSVATLLMATLLMTSMTAALATVRIYDDPGGQIGEYLAKFKALRISGDHVVIDGTYWAQFRETGSVSRRGQLSYFTAPGIPPPLVRSTVPQVTKYCGQNILPSCASGSADTAGYARSRSTCGARIYSR